jgi:hypothetical protein
MLTAQKAQELGQRWVEAWNAHDLDRILSFFDEAVEMSSPGIIQQGTSADGRLKGKATLRAYWTRVFAALPNLRFELLDVSASPHSVVLRYRNDRNMVICEYLKLNQDGLIIEGAANWPLG